MDDGSDASHGGSNTIRIGKVGAYALHAGRTCQINGQRRAVVHKAHAMLA